MASTASPPPPPPTCSLRGAPVAARRWPTVAAAADRAPTTGDSPLDLRQCTRILPLHGIEWTRGGRTCKHVGELSGSGVFFVECNDAGSNQLVVLKGSSTVVADLLATALLQMLSVPTPACRLLEWTGATRAEFRAARAPVIRDLGRKPDELYRAWYCVYEFVPSRTLSDGAMLLADPARQQYFEDIGMIVAADLLLNNVDRLPVGVWSNQGNPNNILLDVEQGRAYAIDQALMAVRVGPARDDYLARVKSFVAASHSVDGSSVRAIATCIETACEHSFAVSTEQRQLIFLGLLRTLRAIAAMDSETVSTLVCSTARTKTGSDWENVWKNGCTALDGDFLFAAVLAVRSGLSEQDGI